jgi:hypothetical protein
MLSTLPSAWADLGAGGNKSPWELAAGAEDATVQAAFGDESALLASRLRQHQIGGGNVKSSSSSSPVMLQLSNLHRHGVGGNLGCSPSLLSLLPVCLPSLPPSSSSSLARECSRDRSGFKVIF